MTTAPRSPAAVARRQLLVDRFVELLESWGDPHAAGHARELLAAVSDAGYPLPPGLDDHVPPPATFTGEGRARARQILADALAAREAQR